MSSLIRIRSAREQMSAIERRIADFILDNSHLLRDYSSQHLANALGISQSSVVKFSQKLGFKGYPDLKLAISEDLVRDPGRSDTLTIEVRQDDSVAVLHEKLLRGKTEALNDTAKLSDESDFLQVVAALATAPHIYICGLGDESRLARHFAEQLQRLRRPAVGLTDLAVFAAQTANIHQGDVLFVIAQNGKHSGLVQLTRAAKLAGARVLTLTRYAGNPIRALSSHALHVATTDESELLAGVLCEAAQRHQIDLLLIALLQRYPELREAYRASQQALEQFLDT